MKILGPVPQSVPTKNHLWLQFTKLCPLVPYSVDEQANCPTKLTPSLAAEECGDHQS